MFDQVGRYLYYDIPLEFLEIDAYKLITSSLTLLFAVTSTAYFTTTILGDEGPPKDFAGRVVFHGILGAAVTVPLWLPTLDWKHDVSWPMVVLVGLAGVPTWLASKALGRRRRGIGLSERVAGWAIASFAVLVGVCMLTVGHGYKAEESRTQFAFLEKTQRAVVGRMGDLLIAKEYDPASKGFRQGRVILINVEDTAVLDVRELPARK